jgi:2'-5' RNA ligase
MSEDAQPLRAFLAIEIAPEIRRHLVAVKEELAATRADVRWVRDAGLHATVQFLGPVRPSVLEQMRGALTAALRDRPPFAVRVNGLGVFPTLRRPRVVWVGLQATELPDLAGRVAQAIAPFGFQAESREFQAHITLGRVRGQRGWPDLEQALKTHWTEDFGSCEIRELVAFRSDLRRDGAVYTTLWTIPLG